MLQRQQLRAVAQIPEVLADLQRKQVWRQGPATYWLSGWWTDAAWMLRRRSRRMSSVAGIYRDLQETIGAYATQAAFDRLFAQIAELHPRQFQGLPIPYRVEIPEFHAKIRNMIPRLIEDYVYARMMRLHKAIILLGARQVGKTTLLQALQKRLESQGEAVRYLNCDLEEERQAVNTSSRLLLDRLTAGKNAIFIDEIQRLENPGLTLKILVDLYPKLKILVTGSSSFELRNRMSEALTGRYIDFLLYPISLLEVLAYAGVGQDLALQKPGADVLLADILCYGLYPEVYLEANPAIKQTLLAKLVESYLFKDILAFQRVRYSQGIVDLARALAYQIGNEVNENELAKRLKMDRKTIVNYIDILEKSFVLTRLPPFSRNPRREIGKQSKIYFLDLGIRNALIGDFNDLSLRPDRGAVWENFLIIERYKFYLNQGLGVQGRFWRTYGGAEVDYIEENPAGQIRAYEFKFGSSDLGRGAESFTRAYKTEVQLINQENYLDFIQGK
jgi:predicted AAA+ superfamily ATPase